MTTLMYIIAGIMAVSGLTILFFMAIAKHPRSYHGPDYYNTEDEEDAQESPLVAIIAASTPETALPPVVTMEPDAVFHQRMQDEQRRAELHAQHVEELKNPKPKAHTKEYARWYYQQNADKIKEARIERYHKKKAQSKKQAAQKKWYAENKERLAAERKAKKAPAMQVSPTLAEQLEQAAHPPYSQQQIRQVALAVAATLAPRPNEAYSAEFGAPGTEVLRDAARTIAAVKSIGK